MSVLYYHIYNYHIYDYHIFDYHIYDKMLVCVMSAVKALLDKDFITQDGNAYIVYDQFFALWRLRQ